MQQFEAAAGLHLNIVDARAAGTFASAMEHAVAAAQVEVEACAHRKSSCWPQRSVVDCHLPSIEEDTEKSFPLAAYTLPSPSMQSHM